MRPGWSISWPSGSAASRAATHSARPASSTSGVVPAQTPRRARPATRASTSTRTIRLAGQRATLRRPRWNTGWVAWARIGGIHGRDRGRSWASWRRRTSTVRRSWRVTAKRSWPTSAVRRSAASSEVPDTRRMPTATSTSATSGPSRPSGSVSSGQMASRPMIEAGAVRRLVEHVGNRPRHQGAAEHGGEPGPQAGAGRHQGGAEAEAPPRSRRTGHPPASTRRRCRADDGGRAVRRRHRWRPRRSTRTAAGARPAHAGPRPGPPARAARGARRPARAPAVRPGCPSAGPGTPPGRRWCPAPRRRGPARRRAWTGPPGRRRPHPRAAPRPPRPAGR